MQSRAHGSQMQVRGGMRQRRCRGATRAVRRSREQAAHARAAAVAEIMEAAAHVFAERGYHGASTQDIADVLGIRQASLYYYFPLQGGRARTGLHAGVEGFFETGAGHRGGPGTAGESFAGLIRAHISPLLDRGHFVQVFLTQRHSCPTRAAGGSATRRAGSSRSFEDVIRQGVRSGEFRADPTRA